MHNARAKNFHPAGALTARAAGSVTELALDVHFRRGLRDREIAGAEPRLRLSEEAVGEMGQSRFQIDETDTFVDRQSLDLGEHRRVGRIEEIAAISIARTQYSDRRLELLHRADLHRRRVRSQHYVLAEVQRVV